MGVALFIALERKLPDLEVMLGGKSLARYQMELDDLARTLPVPPLSQFLSIDPDEAAAFLESEGTDPSDLDLPPLQQFSAAEGLATVRALAAHLEADPDSVPDADGVLSDLRECERILAVAAAEGVRFHFEVDF